MTAGKAVFLDTNILVYLSFDHFLLHQTARSRVGELERGGHPLWISRQILREFLAVASRPGILTSEPSLAFLVGLVEEFTRQFHLAEDTAQVTGRLVELIQEPGARGRQVHDANIVATMLAHGIGALLTHNVRDFRRYEPALTILPIAPRHDAPLQDAALYKG